MRDKVFIKARNHHPPWPPFLLEGTSSMKGGNPEDLDALRVFTRKASKSSEDTSPQEWGEAGSGVEKSTLSMPKAAGGSSCSRAWLW
jgi:hypothetical protein